MIFKNEEVVEEGKLDLLPDALVTVSFEGLSISCINPEGECEVGMIKRDDHTLSLDIVRVKPSLINFEHSLRLDLDIKIDVTYPHPNQERAEAYTVGAFDREQSHRSDFRWMIDLAADDLFHGEAVDFQTRAANGRVGGLNPIFVIPRGQLYTRQRLKSKLIRVRWDDASPVDGEPRFLGQVGHVFGIDILAEDRPGSKVVLTNIDNQGQPFANIPPLELPYEPGVKYEINISNLCPVGINSALPGSGTDFRFYYDVINGPDGKKFDLKNSVLKGEPGDSGHVVPDRPDLGVNGDPQACEKTHIGLSLSLRGF
jgi:hypothetical protein